MWARIGIYSVFIVFVLINSTNIEAEVLDNFIKTTEIKQSIEMWRVAKGKYYSSLYNRDITIRIENDAIEYVLSEYKDKNLPNDFNINPKISVEIIKGDMERVLNGSQYFAIKRIYGSLAAGSIKFRGEFKSIRINIEKTDVSNSIAKFGCNIIPCDRKKCRDYDCAALVYEFFAK